jgi:MSHA biogenesis protein MshQ
MKKIIAGAVLFLMMAAAWAATYTMGPASLPTCSGGSWSVNSGTFTCSGTIVLNAGDSITPSGNVTINGSVTTSGGGSAISLTNVSLNGNFFSSNDLVLTLANSTVNGNVSSSNGAVNVSGGAVTGSITNSGGNGIQLQNTAVGGNVTSSCCTVTISGGSVGGNVSTSGGNGIKLQSGAVITGSVTSSCCTVIVDASTVSGGVVSNGGNGPTIQNGSTVTGGVSSSSSTVKITGSTVSGAISTSGGNGVQITNSTIPSGSITASSVPIDISGSTVGSTSSSVNVTGNNTVNIENGSTVYGNVTAASWQNPSTVVDSSSIVHGVCTSSQTSTSSPASFNNRCDGGASSPGTSNNPGPFNAFDLGSPSGTVKGVIFTKVAGTNFKLTLVAVSSDGTQNQGFNNKTVTMDLVANTGTPGVGYGSNYCPNSLVSISGTSATSPSFTKGRADNASFTVTNAYPDVRVRMSSTSGNTTTVSCSMDSFAIKPDHLIVLAQDATQTTAGTSRTLSGVTASATVTPIHNAGQPFQLTLTAYNSANAATTNYSATVYPQGLTITNSSVNAVSPSSAQVASTAGIFTAGAFSNSSSSANGVIVSTTASYNDVGIVSPVLADQSFAQIDQGDGTPSSCSGWWTCSTAINIGRFVPDHFSVSVTPACSATATSFTYSGQPFSVTVTAYNWGGSSSMGSQMYNYNTSTGFAKAVTLSDVSTSTPDSNGSWNSTNTIASTAFSAGSTTTPLNGVATTTTSAFTFSPLPMTPKTLQVRATDADGVSSASYDNVVMSMPLVRNGRLRLFNAYGAVGTTLSMPVQAQYWSKDGVWVSNSDDSCTAIVPTSVYLSSNSVTMSPASTVTLSGGAANLPLTTTATVTTSASVAINLGATGSGSDLSCLSTHGGTPSNQSWLRSQNGSTGACANLTGSALWQRDPSGTVSFGIYTPESRRMGHMREAFW